MGLDSGIEATLRIFLALTPCFFSVTPVCVKLGDRSTHTI